MTIDRRQEWKETTKQIIIWTKRLRAFGYTKEEIANKLNIPIAKVQAFSGIYYANVEKTERNEIIRRLHKETNLSYGKIAKVFNISRQRVYQICKSKSS